MAPALMDSVAQKMRGDVLVCNVDHSTGKSCGKCRVPIRVGCVIILQVATFHFKESTC